MIVAVPNAASRQCRLLGPRYAFFDPESHVHQFTPRSLDLVFARHGFRRMALVSPLPYTAFGWLQGLLNFAGPRRNYLYYRLKRGWDFGMPRSRRLLLDLLHLALAAAACPAAAVLALADRLDPVGEGALVAVYAQPFSAKGEIQI